MTTEQERKMLEAAAKACGIDGYSEQRANGSWVILNEFDEEVFDSINNPADTAEMCAEIGIETAWFEDKVLCALFVGYKSWAEFKDHDNSRLKSWMYAATMVAAKIGGYTD